MTDNQPERTDLFTHHPDRNIHLAGLLLWSLALLTILVAVLIWAT